MDPLGRCVCDFSWQRTVSRKHVLRGACDLAFQKISHECLCIARQREIECVCVCLYVYFYVFMYICLCMFSCFMFMCICLCVCLCIHVYVHVSVCVSVPGNTCMGLGQGQRWALGTNRWDVVAVGLRGDTSCCWGIQLSGSERHGVRSSQGQNVTWGKKDGASGQQ